MLPPPHLPAPRAIRDLRLDGSHAPGGTNYERVVTEHLPMVHGMAHRLLADLPSAVDDVTLAVFEAFTLRWKTLSRPTVIASWLARTTLLAAKGARKQFAAPRPALDGAKDPRSAAQRTHDALIDLAAGHLRFGTLPTSRGARPGRCGRASCRSTAHRPRSSGSSRRVPRALPSP